MGNTIYWGAGGASNRGGNTVVEKNDEDFRKQSQAFHGGARIERESGGQGADAQEVGYRHSIEEIIATPSQLRGSVVYIEYSGYRLHSW